MTRSIPARNPCRMVLIRGEKFSEINSPSAHAPLTQTAPDEESEAE